MGKKETKSIEESIAVDLKKVRSTRFVISIDLIQQVL